MALWEEFDGLDGSVEICVDRGRAYAWYDAMQAGAHPDPTEVLTDAQRRSLELLVAKWAHIRDAVNRCYPAKLRPCLEWSGLTVTLEEADGLAFVELSGVYTGEEDGHLSEHGIGAVVLGCEVVGYGERNLTWTQRGRRPVDVSLRPHPDYRELSLQAVREFADNGDFAGLRAVNRAFDGVEGGWSGAARVLDDWIWTLPPLEAASYAGSAAFLFRHGDRIVEEADIGRSLVVLKALVAAKCYKLPRNPLAETSDPELARRWVAIGVKPDRAGVRDDHKPLWVHRRASDMFDLLLELGADPRDVVDDCGVPYESLSDDILRILWRHHPELQPHARSSPRRRRCWICGAARGGSILNQAPMPRRWTPRWWRF